MTPQEVAAGVAADIRHLGPISGLGGACFVAAPTLNGLPVGEAIKYLDALRAVVGKRPARWFDSHTTDAALKVLDLIASIPESSGHV